MAICEYCGAFLADGWRVCPDCCAPVKVKAPESSVSTYVVDTKLDCDRIQYTDEDRQSILDKMRKLLIGEKWTWRIVSILLILAYLGCIFSGVTSIVAMIMYEDANGEYYGEETEDPFDGPYTQTSVEVMTEEDDYSTEFGEFDVYMLIFMLSWTFTAYGFELVVPAVIVGFIMSAKSGKVLKKLYVDCSLAYRRGISLSPMILGIIFNPFTLIFTIPLRVVSSKNRSLIMETAEIQRAYFK